jgi:LysR family glycine cleavage system transcriptional activator
VELTAAGRELFAETAPALERIAIAAARLRIAQPVQESRVRINARPSFALRWLIPHLPSFVRAHPEIEPLVVTSTLEPARLAPAGFDVAIRRDAPRDRGTFWPAGMRPRAFLREAALPVAAPALLAERPVALPRDLAAHVLLHTATRERDWPDWLARAGCPDLRPAGELRFEHQQFTLQAAIDGMGVALGLSVLAAADLAARRLVPAVPHGPRLRLAPYCYAISVDAPASARQFGSWLEREGVLERKPARRSSPDGAGASGAAPADVV